MSAQHTQGRLEANGQQLVDESGHVVASCGSFRTALHFADASRLAACWNACRGFDTDLLINIDMMGDTLKQSFDGMQAEVWRVDKREAAAHAELAAASTAPSDMSKLALHFRDERNQAQDELAAARALLTEVLAADDKAIAELKATGLNMPDTDASPAWAMTERIRTFLKGGV